MPKATVALQSFNRGIVSPLGLARTDLDRLRLSAETQNNWMPRTLGSMMLRPGLGYIGSTASNAAAKFLAFVFSTDDTALIEVTNAKVRVWVDDALITRPSVSTAVSNGDFGSDLTGWTDADESGGTSAWATGGYMSLTGNGTAAAIRRQTVTVGGADQNAVHALNIVVQRGPVLLRVGSSSGGDEYVTETELRTGAHSIAFTPTGNFYIQLFSRLKRAVLVDSIAVASAGVMELTAPWLAADLAKLRYDQSGDVLFVACEGYQQRRIERRANDSWSVVLYQPEDGPFRIENVGPITLTAAALSGNTTLTASAALFRSTHVGALFKLSSSGQTVTRANITAENTFTNAIRITGVEATRIFTIILTGAVWADSSTVTLQRSLDVEGNWEDVSGKTWTAATTETYDDGLDNQIVFYRIGIKTGGYAGSDDISATLQIGTGSIDGVARITAFTSATVVDVEVLEDFGSTAATDVWAEGLWSPLRGWPTAVAFYEGRLWWAGKDRIVASVSDAFESFDPDTEGDSGPINRTIGSGPVDTINFILALSRLILGAEGAEKSIRSSSFDEPITPTLFNIKDASTQGSAAVAAVKVDKRGYFVQRGGSRVFELVFDVEQTDYTGVDRTLVVPEIGEPSVTLLEVQRQPDTRIHSLRSDGTVAVLVSDPAENISCWVTVETDGDVEDIVVLPGTLEDQVYYVVNRTINSATVRYLEKWAREDQCVGGTVSRLADSYVTFTNGSPSATITGLTHVIGEEVIVWADGKCLADANGDIATFTVDGSGQITVTNDGSAYLATTGVVGLAYRARYKSTKLAYAAGGGTALTMRKRVDHLGLILKDTHAKGVKYGPDFDTMDDMPAVEDGAEVDGDYVWDHYDKDSFAFNGTWDTNSRVCLEANAPRPATVLAMVMAMVTNDKA